MNLFENEVDFIIEGAETERILKYCSDKGLKINNLKKEGYKLFGSLRAKDYKKLKKIRIKYGLKMKITNKRGYYFFIKKNQTKAGFVFGLIFVILSSIILNKFIWEINIYGNKDVDAETIIQSAEEMGLKKGTLSKKHDSQTVEWYIMNENEGLALVEVNIQGSCANILVREATKPAEMKSDDDIPVNIIASRYGVIRKMDVFDGQDAVKVGDAVMKGDLLVSAVYEDRHNKLTLKHARANIIAETDYSIEVEFPLEQIIEKRGNINKKTYEIDLMGLKIKLGNINNQSHYIVEEEEFDLHFLWIKLPINLIIKRYYDVKYNTITYNFEQGRAGAYQLLEHEEEEIFKNAKIISRKDTEKIKDNKYIIKADYICLMDIGQEQALESDIPWENTDDMS